MAIEVPNIQITTYDYSQVSPILEDSLNTGIVIDSPTGPMEITKVSSLSEFLKLYTTTGVLTADDHITMLHAAKLLQFTPVHISRACSSEVLPARVDRPDSAGNSIVYTDTSYNPYYKEHRYTWGQSDDTKLFYVKFNQVSGGQLLLETEDGSYVLSNNDDNTFELVETEDSPEKPSRNLWAIAMSKDSDSPTIPGVDSNRTLLINLEVYQWLTQDKNKAQVDLNKACSIETIFKYFNSVIDYYKLIKNGSVTSDTIAPKYVSEDIITLSKLSSVSVEGEYINVSTSMGIELDEISPEPSKVVDNLVTSNYAALIFNEENRLNEFTEINESNDKTYVTKSGTSVQISNGIKGDLNYYNLNGLTYTVGNTKNTNSVFPSIVEPMSFYTGMGDSELDVLQESKNKVSLQDYIIYFTDSQMANGTYPRNNNIVVEYDLALANGYDDGTKYYYNESEADKYEEGKKGNVHTGLFIKGKSYSVSRESTNSDKPVIDDYALFGVEIKLIGNELNKLVTVTNGISDKYVKITKPSESEFTKNNDLYIRFGSNDNSSNPSYTKYDINKLGKNKLEGYYEISTSGTDGVYHKLDSISYYRELSNYTDRYLNEFKFKFTTLPNSQLINNCAVEFKFIYHKILSKKSEIDGVSDYYLSSDINDIEVKYLYLNVGSPEGRMTGDNVINVQMNNVNTVQKLIYRVAEFFTYKNRLLYKNLWNTKTDEGKTIDEVGDLTQEIFGIRSSEWGLTNGINLNEDSYHTVDKIVSNTDLYYIASEITSHQTNFDESKIIADIMQLGEVEGGKNLHNYNISGSAINSNNKLYENQWVKVIRTLKDADSSITIFYNGQYPKAQLPGETLVQISTAPLTYLEFYNELVANMKTKYNLAPINNGVALYEISSDTTYTIENSGIFGDSQVVKTRDFTELLNSASLIVVSKYISNDSICRFSINVNDKDPELYDLTLTRGNNSTDYSISFNPSKVDGYGIMRYYTYVNDEDNGSKDFYLFRVNDSQYNRPENSYTSPYWGGEVTSLEAGSLDYRLAYDRFYDFLGTYYDFIFDAGYANISVAKAISSLCQSIHALGILTSPDVYNYKELITYRQSLGIDHWSTILQCPRTPDSTLGEFIVQMSPGVQYLQRVILNKQGGKEFAPTFWFTNGSVSLKPKYKYDKKDVQKELINQQICPIVFDRARLQSYFLMDLTMQKTDSSLSESSAVRMINIISHLADSIAQGYIGRYNDASTRDEFVSALKLAIDTRMMTNQQYTMADYKIVCDSTNNPPEQIELRNLVVDIKVKFTPGIRYIKVYQKVYKLSQDLNAV